MFYASASCGTHSGSHRGEIPDSELVADVFVNGNRKLLFFGN